MSLFLRLSDIQTSKHPAKGNSKGAFFDKYLSIILFTSSQDLVNYIFNRLKINELH